MTFEEAIRLVVSFLGGGVVVSVIECIRQNRADRKERKVNYLDAQIRNLYGPLYYFVSQSDKLFELNKRFHEAYSKEFIGKKYSRDKRTQAILKETSGKTLEIANTYIDEVEKNNEKIKEILDNNYSYIDPDDVDIFIKFYEHHIRLKKEKDEEGRISTPLLIYQEIGDISFLRPEFIKRVKAKFKQKKTELEEMVN